MVEVVPPRTAARSRAEARRSEALQLAGELVKAGLIGPCGLLDQARAFEHYLRSNDGSNLAKQ